MTAPPDIVSVLPLTPAQQGILLHSVAGQEHGVYLNQVVLTLAGEVDEDRLRQSWERAVLRHDALRTAFVWEGLDRPLQAVRRTATLPWSAQDWSGEPPAARDQLLEAYLASDRATPLDLMRAPLMRLHLIRTGAATWWLVWTYHHVLLDGWSTSLVIREVLDGYQFGPAAPEPGSLAAPSYADHVEWLGDRDPAEAERFWRGRLAGCPAPTPLPGSARDPAAETGELIEISAGLSEGELAGLRAMGKSSRLTVGTMLHASWALVLSRCAGRSDVVFGSVVSGRPAEISDVDSAVGLFSNTLPTWVQVPRAQSVTTWLRSLQDELAQARVHQYSSLAQVAHWAGATGAGTLFDTVLAWENYPDRLSGSESGGPLRVTGVRFAERPHYAISVTAAADSELTIRLLADGRRYDAETVRWLAAQLRTALLELAGRPTSLVGELVSAAPADRVRLTGAWAGGGSPAAGLKAVGAALDAQFRATPTATALEHEAQALTYADLGARIAAGSGQLAALGAGPETMVGVCFAHPVQALIAQLSVIRAGAVVVPLDPGDLQRPAESAAGCAIVMTDAGAARALREVTGRKVVVLGADDDHGSLARSAEVDPRAAICVLPADEGQPGRVVLSQVGVLSHVNWLRAVSPLVASDRLACRCGPAAGWLTAVLWALTSGACVVLAGQQLAKPGTAGGQAWADEQEQARASVALVTVPVLEAALAGDRPLPACLRTVIAYGDPLAQGPAARFGAGGPATRAVVLGFAETSGAAASASPDAAAGRPAPLGRPVAGTSLYLLDEQLSPVPPGVLGRLYVAGDGLARGYLGQPGRTAERFVPLPWARTGARGFRTGVLARWRADGELDFDGHIERELTVSGLRLRPDEIERTLASHDSVRRAVVVAAGPVFANTGNLTRLVGYLVPTASQRPAAEIRDWLATRLPRAMVPATLAWIDELPLTAGGQVDRAALPSPDELRPELAQEFVPPRGETERLLAGIWATVLGIDRVGIHDNFYELGGDSIMSLRILSLATGAGLRVTLQQLLDHQTVASLASVAATGAGVGSGAGFPGAGDDRDLPLTPVQHWFFEQELRHRGHWNLGVSLALDLGQDSIDTIAGRLRPVLAAMVARHQALRTGFSQDRAGRWRAFLLPQDKINGLDPLTVAQVPAGLSPEAWTGSLTEIGTGLQAFRLDQPPLLRAALVDGGRADRVRLLLTGHHLVVDGVSWRILLDDLALGYDQAAAGHPVRLRAATTPPGTWAAALARQVTEPRFTADACFWRSQAADPAVLPVEFPDAPARSSESAVRHVQRALAEPETRQLIRDGARVYRARADDLLITALSRAVAARTGRTEMLIALESHGREQEIAPGIDLSETVGWLTAIAPVRLRLPDPEQDPGQSLIAIKEQLRAIPLRGLGYGVLRYLGAGGPRDLGQAPVPVISFNNLGQFDVRPGRAGQAGAPGGLDLRLAPEPPPPAHHPENDRPALLEITCVTEEGALWLTFSYSATHHSRQTIRALADETVSELKKLTAHCEDADRPVFTPSDFPESGLDQAQLDLLMSEIDLG